MQKVIISILHYGNPENTINCLKSLSKIDLTDLELETLVMDNGTREPLNLDVSNFKDIGLAIVRNSYNSGFSGGHNLVYERVQDKDFDYFLLLNNDSLMDEKCLQELLKPMSDSLVGAVVPKVYFTKGKEFHKNRYKEMDRGKVIWYAGGYIDWDNVQSKHIGIDEVDKGQFDNEKNINFATGACLLLKKELIKKIGLFDERYFLYFEDADLSLKILRSGYKIVYAPKAVVWHNNAGSSSSGSSLHDYFLTRNRLLFGMKYAPIKIRGFLLKESLHLLKSGREWQRKGIRDYFLHKFGKGSYEIK